MIYYSLKYSFVILYIYEIQKFTNNKFFNKLK